MFMDRLKLLKEKYKHKSQTAVSLLHKT